MDDTQQEKEFKLPTNLEYQRLLMAHRVLTVRGAEPTERLYNLAKELYNSADALGLEFSENFRVTVVSEKNLAEQLQRGEQDTLRELSFKIEAVHKALVERIGKVNAVIKPEATTEPTQAVELTKTDLERNIELLSEALQFNDTQKQVLSFYASSAKGRFGTILNAAHTDDVVSHEDYIDSLAILLDVEDEAKESLKAELDPDSVLVGVNFLAHDEKSNNYSVDKPLQRILDGNYKSTAELLASLLGPNPTTELTAADYEYMTKDLEAMAATFEGFFGDKDPKASKNMTIGGPPGTGKTQVTAVLSEKLKAPAFLIGVAEKSKTTGFSLEEPTREDRINALVRSAFIVRQTGMRAILVFDEAEDILRDLNAKGTNETGSKAFINELLEGLGAPTIFISNRTDLFDPATTRRILPYYSMNYMPFSARVNTIVTKAEKYIGANLSQDDVKGLSRFARSLSVAVIDSCVRTVGQRRPSKEDKPLVLQEIKTEFERALKAQNGGVPPLPIKGEFDLEKFDPELIAASEDVVALQQAFAANAGNLAGKDITIIGHTETGRESIAQYLAAATGMEPRVVTLNQGALVQDPVNAHALDLERATLDESPLIFTGATEFLAKSDGHPFMDRIRAHSQPTFFVGGVPHNVSDDVLGQALSHLTFVARTDNLSNKQMQKACKEYLGIDVGTEELRGIKNVGIGAIMIVRRQLETIGKLGDKEAAIERINTVSSRLATTDDVIKGFGQYDDHEQRGGFAGRLEDMGRAKVVVGLK